MSASFVGGRSVAAERALYVAPSLGERKASLGPDAGRALEQRRRRQLPAGSQLIREVLGGIVAALESPIRVGGNEGQRVDRWSTHGLADELRSERGDGA